MTAEAIEGAREFLNGAKADDTVVLFVAGHGTWTNDEEAAYYYVTHDTDLGRLRETAADFALIEGLLDGIGARRKLFLMDTCASGERDAADTEAVADAADARGIQARAIRDLGPAVGAAAQGRAAPRSFLFDRERYIYNDLSRRTGAVVFSSSRGTEYSYEDPALRNGVFTENVLLALTSDQADGDGDGLIQVEELRDFVSAAVSDYTGGLQNPTVDRDNREQPLAFPAGP